MAFSSDYTGTGIPALFLATGGGGIWRSADFSTSAPEWQPLTDDLSWAPAADRPRLSNVGAIAVDPFRPRVLYASSGDPEPPTNIYGHGLMKSVDGGNSWTYLGNLSGFAGATPGASRIFVDPTGPREACSLGPCAGSRVFAAGDFRTLPPQPGPTIRGIFMSSDSGAHWTPFDAGIPPGLAVTDLDYTVTSLGLTMYAAINDPSGQNPQFNGVWSSTNLGPWKQMPFESPILDFKGATRSLAEFGFIHLAVDHTTYKGAYALVRNGDWVINAFKLTNGVWRHTASGLTWDDGSRGVFCDSACSIGIDPSDGSVYVGGVNSTGSGFYHGLYQSRDGGASWHDIDDGSNGVRPHTDQHSWAFAGGAVYAGNDGGVYRFTPLPNGQAGPGTWTSLNTSSLADVLSSSVGPSPVSPGVVLMSAQDQDTSLRSGGTWSAVGTPAPANLGENSRVRFDPFDASFAYGTGESAPNFFSRSTDGGKTFVDATPTPDNVPDAAVIAFHPATPGRLATGTAVVWESTNHAASWASRGRPNIPLATVTALAYGPGDTLHAAWGERLFRTTRDGADAWPEPNPGKFDGEGAITGIVVDRQNTQRVYLITSIGDAGGGHIWRSFDGGTSWFEITSDFPSATSTPRAIALRSDTSAVEPQLFVATNVGVWAGQLINGSWHWQRMGSGMPDVDVEDIQYNPISKVAYAATFGRGVLASYLGFVSDAAPGSLAVGNTTVVLGKDLDGRILENVATYGNAYAGWVELQGGGRVTDALAGTSLNGIQFAFGRGTDNGIYINQAGLGRPWSGWAAVPGLTTSAAPAAAVSTTQNQIWTFATGASDKRIYQNHATYGQAFVGWTQVPGGWQSNSGLAAAVLPSRDYTFLFMRGLDDNIYFNQSTVGSSWVGWRHVPGAQTTDAAPAVVADNDNIYVFVKATDGRIMKNHAVFGGAFDGWTEVPGGLLSDTAPSAAILQNGIIFLYAKRSSDGRINVNEGAGGNFGSWFEVGGGF